MPDRCEVLPGDSVVARRGGGLLWVDAPGSPALVAALHACLGVSGPGADRVLVRRRRQVGSLAHGPASFALVLADTRGRRHRRRAVVGQGSARRRRRPVSGSSVEGCTLASGFPLGPDALRRPRPGRAADAAGRRLDLVEGTVPGSGAMLQLAARRPVASAVPPATPRPSSFSAPSDAGFGSAAGGSSPPERRAESGEQTAFWRPETAAAPVLRFDDGMVVTVDEDLVLGRRPDSHELVTGGNARPVPIADTQNVLSSAHAALQRAGREVSLVDLGSLNGTHVAGPEATEWTQLEPGVAHPLSDGDRLLLGWTVITFEQPRTSPHEKRTARPRSEALERGLSALRRRRR